MNNKMLAMTTLLLGLSAWLVHSAENLLPLAAGKFDSAQVTIHPEEVVKAGLPARPIGVSENLFFSSDKAYPRRKHTQTESLKMIGGQTIRGMEGDTGDYMIWAMPPYSVPAPH